ncbi:MAG: hypothetical protein EOO46_24320 [Flavobacterium sp.]|nr:MAG: hypothetical protein EOO46_24320 [Flavobacterium sp.]
MKKYQYWNSDIIVHPWCDISIINSEFSEPKGKTRNLMITGLEKIYDDWKITLDKIGEPYYLKIWLYEPRISKSQVVCAIGERIEYYNNLFYKVDDNFKSSDFYNKLSSDFKWNAFEDANIYSEEDLLSPSELYKNIEDYNYSINLLSKLKRRNYRLKKENDDTLFYVPKGKIWIGEKVNVA